MAQHLTDRIQWDGGCDHLLAERVPQPVRSETFQTGAVAGTFNDPADRFAYQRTQGCPVAANTSLIRPLAGRASCR